MVKFTFSFEFNPNTDEVTNIKLVNKEKIEKRVDYTEPILLLQKNVYELSLPAIELLGVGPGDKLKIQYKTYGNETFPVIAPSSIWGEEDGNKLTKALTVSCRGIANETLRKYGEKFYLVEDENMKGSFILKVGKEKQEEEKVEEKIIEVSPVEPEDTSLDDDVYEIKDVNFEELIKDLS